MMVKNLLAALLCFAAPLLADDTMVVHLTTENQLIPLNLVPIESKESGLEDSYIKRLEQVIRYDLNHNGMTYTTTTKPLMEVKLHIHQKKLGANVRAIARNTSKNIQEVALSGDFNHDRQQLHLVADAIYESYFPAPGIATTHILYTVRRQTPNGNDWLADVWEADYDGANARQLTQNAGYCVTPNYVPPASGKLPGNFLYVSYKTGQPKIYVGTLKDGKNQRFSYLGGNQLMPMMSRQRDHVAFICDVTGNPDLFLQEFSLDKGAVGKPRQIFAANLSTQGTPTFSPDGKRVAFVSDKDGTPRIYSMNIPPPGTPIEHLKPTLISKYNRGSTAPAWSPDGKKIAFCSLVDGYRQIFVYDFANNEERQLTQGRGNKENPTWSPNSLCLIYNRMDDNSSDLYHLNINRPEPTKITTLNSAEKHYPAWEPR